MNQFFLTLASASRWGTRFPGMQDGHILVEPKAAH